MKALILVKVYDEINKKDVFEKVCEVEDYESFLWIPKYNDLGECEIYIQASSEYKDWFKIGNFIYRSTDDMFCEIKDVNIDNDDEKGSYLIATGKDCSDTLGDRIVRYETVFSGKPYEFIKLIIENNIIEGSIETRKINNFEFECNINNDDHINIVAFGEDLFTLIQSICKTYGYGFKLTYNLDEQKYKFILYQGESKCNKTDETYVEFSPDFANIVSSSYNENSEGYKNVCYVKYLPYNQTKNEDVKELKSVYDTSRYNKEPEGKDRKEICVDGTSVKKEMTVEELIAAVGEVSINGSEYRDASGNLVAKKIGEDKVKLENDTYFSLIETLAYNTLAEHNIKKEFNGIVDTQDSYVYKVDYNLGDIVKVIDDYGAKVNARIVEIMESDDIEDGHQVEPTFEYINEGGN